MKTAYLSIIGLLLLTVTGNGGQAGNQPGHLSTKSSHIAGKFVVMLEADAPPLQTNLRQNGAAITGIASIDVLCNRYGVSRIKPYYAGKLTKPALVEVASRLYIFSLDNEYKAADVVFLFAADSHIHSAELITPAELCYLPNDPFISLQWQLDRTQTFAAWDVVRGDASRHSVIAIIDTGIDYDHEDMATNIWVNPGEDINGNGAYDPDDFNGVDDDENGFEDDIIGWDFGGNDWDPVEELVHGTGVASCASEVTDNGIMGAGMGFSARLMALKAFIYSELIDGYSPMLYAAENGAQIINCSWGWPVYAEYEQAIIDAVWAEDVLIIASAGSVVGQLIYPAAYEHVMAVAATDENDHVAYFSTVGEWIDICAPGVEIYMLWDDNFSMLSGTSFSTAFVSGLAALVRAGYPNLTNAQVEQLMKDAADDIYPLNPGYEGLLGAGRINSAACFATDVRESHLTPERFEAFINYPNPFNASTEIHFMLPEAGDLTLEIFNILGEKIATLARGYYAAGSHSISWDATFQPSGVYFYKIKSAGWSLINKCLLLK